MIYAQKLHISVIIAFKNVIKKYNNDKIWSFIYMYKEIGASAYIQFDQIAFLPIILDCLHTV